MDDDEGNERMTELARCFPSMVEAAGPKPWAWDAVALDRWATTPISHVERVTAQFLLAVWAPDTKWKAGGFDVMEARE